MPMRLHEIHPALVHLPLGLLPAAVLADAVGAATGSQRHRATGRTLMPWAAAAMALAGAAGFMAQPAVRAEGQAHDLLATHRNLNVALLGLTGGLALWRRRHRPGPVYLAAALVAAAGATCSGYLGGRMVYGHGVGVGRDGFDPERSPDLATGTLTSIGRVAAAHAAEGLSHAVHEGRHGNLAPALRRLEE